VLPELRFSVYPMGYETITYYAPAIVAFNQSPGNAFLKVLNPSLFLSAHKPLLDTYRAGPLFYVLVWGASAVSGVDAFLMLKVLGPILFGGLAVSFFLFLKRGLNLGSSLALLTTLIMVFQPAALRESWDRYRTILALIFLFGGLASLRTKSKFKPLFIATLGVLTALSRDYVAVLFLVTVLGFTVFEKKDRLVSLIALAPTVALLSIMFNPVYLSWNYFSSSSPFAVTSYWWVVQDALSIFAVCYIPLLPFILIGFRRNSILNPLLGSLLVGSFSVALTPWFAVPGYNRWLMLLVFPFCVYSVLAFERFSPKKYKKKLATAIVLVFMLLGAGYSTGAFSITGFLHNSYVPVNLVQSSIPLDQIEPVKDVLRWLDENASVRSSLLTEERFYGWTLMYLNRANNDIEVFAYAANSNPEKALEEALNDGFHRVYLIWYNDTDLQDYKTIYSKDGISIFQYEL
jgi:hypothetical protein